jgi:hypothetical protein
MEVMGEEDRLTVGAEVMGEEDRPTVGAEVITGAKTTKNRARNEGGMAQSMLPPVTCMRR